MKALAISADCVDEFVLYLIDKMFENGVTSVLISDGHQKPLGVISDRDLLKDMVDLRKQPEKTLAKDLNYTPLITLQGDESMVYAMKLMENKRIKRAALVKDGQLIGMLTESMIKGAALPIKASTD